MKDAGLACGSFAFIISIVVILAVFERNNDVSLSQDYKDYQLGVALVRSLIECSVFCYSLDDCRAFLMNLVTGECQSYNTDISDFAGSSQITDDTYFYFREAERDLVAGRGNFSWQISQHRPDEGFSYLALDGNTFPKWSGKSCMHTSDAMNPWWAVDFGGSVKVKRIVVYQRTDSCCVGRFESIQFMIGDSISDIENCSGKMCATYVGPAGFTPFPIIISCDSVVRGRYLKLYRETNYGALAFCEIKVFSF